MSLKGLDINVVTNLTSQYIDYVTCLECCRYYVAPTSAACGHTLCHGCWLGRRKCPTCACPIQRKSLQSNLPMQKHTEHVKLLIEQLEKQYNFKLDEMLLEIPNTGAQDDPNKNVKDWLANSQNNFSAPISSQSTQDLNPPVEYSTTKVQVHESNTKTKSPVKVNHVPIPQDNWDKIEEVSPPKGQLDIIETMEIESLDKDDTEYVTENPRRSTRNRELTNSSIKELNDMQNDEMNTKSSAIVSIKPTKKIRETWKSVKKMKKEFSKLNKENRNKLNVSIEMCKKTQMSNNNAKQVDSGKLTPDIIEDDTPNVLQTEKDIEQQPPNKQSTSLSKLVDTPATFRMDVNEEAVQENDGIVPPLIAAKQDKNSRKPEHSNINENLREKSKVKFVKKAALLTNTKQINHAVDKDRGNTAATDDIQISIKIGNTITNICIKKKENDVQVKVNTDREIQTSLGKRTVPDNNITTINNNPVSSQNIEINFGESGTIYKSTQTETQSVIKATLDKVEDKSILNKKSTASADTKAAPFDITESVEKELSDIMECVENDTVNKSRRTQTKKTSKPSEPVQGSSQKENIPEDIDFITDVDIFEGEVPSASNVQSLKSTQKLKSKILVPSQNKNKRKLNESIGGCLNTSSNSPRNKKTKIAGKEHDLDEERENAKAHTNSKLSINDSECQNYDLVMDKVFANIDKDIKTIHKHGNLSKHDIEEAIVPKTQNEMNKKPNEIDQKYSENIFSIMDTDESHIASKKNTQVLKPSTEYITPTLCQEHRSIFDRDKETVDAEVIELGTPFQTNYDSDESVVEETPQKNVSIPKTRQRSGRSFQMDSSTNKEPKTSNKKQRVIESVVNITDSVVDSTMIRKNTPIEVEGRPTLDTPITINRFVDHIKHNSTPLARKSLNFTRQNDSKTNNDPERTLCPSPIAVAKTTQEKEFMNEVFQVTGSPLNKKTVPVIRPSKLCIAGSCLTGIELAKLKFFCKQREFSYVENYTKDLTHLVVGVDEENKSLRSVKYMYALAAGKWIVSFAWVEKCLQSNTVVPEEPFEALDGNGEPGPRRSRLTTKKLFDGITFYCMGPFSVLDGKTLKHILEAAGGRVVDDAKDVRVKDDKPALLLAESENTQEDKFTYIAINLGVVPVSYDWVVNCLGNYTLDSIQELLLCPFSILPPEINSWPPELIVRDFD